MRKTVFLLLAPWILACAGWGTVDAAAHLEPLCEASEGAVAGELVQLERPAKKLPEGVQIEVGGAQGIVLDKRAVHPEGLDQALGDALANAQALRAGPTDLQISADPATNPEFIGYLLQVSAAHGYRTAHFVVGSSERYPIFEYPDPEYAIDLKVRLNGMTPMQRNVVLAEELDGLIPLCPGAQQVFKALATSSPHTKCVLLAHGLGESLPSCIATDGNKVITAAQIAIEPRSRYLPTSFPVPLDPENPIEVPEGVKTWGDWAPDLAKGR